MVNFGAKVVAVDASTAIDVNAENLNSTKTVFFIQGDMYNLPLKENIFDYVLMFGVLQHLPEKRRAIGIAYSYLFKLKTKNTASRVFQDESGLRPRSAGVGGGGFALMSIWPVGSLHHLAGPNIFGAP